MLHSGWKARVLAAAVTGGLLPFTGAATEGTSVNGPDLQFTTIEDFQEESSATFQAAIASFPSKESLTPREGPLPRAEEQPAASFGVAMDDVVIAWREFKLVPESVKDCTGNGQCPDTAPAATPVSEDGSE